MHQYSSQAYTNYQRLASTYFTQFSKSQFVLCGTITTSRVLKIQVNTIKAVFPQEVDGGYDKLTAVGLSGQHGCHLLGTKVPASNPQQGLQVGVRLLQTIHLFITITE